jgi:hypothetical protein
VSGENHRSPRSTAALALHARRSRSRPCVRCLGPAEERISAFERELITSGRTFEFSDCAIGNIVFAGAYLAANRRFNDAVDDYCGLLGSAAGDDRERHRRRLTRISWRSIPTRGLLASEADIVDAKRQNRITDIYLSIRKPTGVDAKALATSASRGRDEVARVAPPARAHSIRRSSRRWPGADLIVYAAAHAATRQLFPSYLTEGLSDAIAGNLSALKLLITNIHGTPSSRRERRRHRRARGCTTCA